MARFKLGVVGSPISHSKSPDLHSAAYATLGLDWDYRAYEVSAGELATFIAGLDTSWRGLSVTMPLKREAWMLSSEHDSSASLTGAVNTLAVRSPDSSGFVHGYNTDVYGIIEAFRASGVQSIRHALIIGAGATAESAVVAVRALGASHVTVALRDASKLTALTELADALNVTLSHVGLDRLDECAPVDIAVSTVPSSAEVSVAAAPLRPDAFLLDVAYAQWPSERALEWIQLGGGVVSGLTMLAYQALIQVLIFVNGSADAQLPHEDRVRNAMFSRVGLDSRGLVPGTNLS